MSVARTAAALLALALLAPGPAAADAIHIPDDCPDGWEGRRFGHGGRCYPIDCDGDAACGLGGECAEVARCWEEVVVPRGRSRTVRHDWVPTETLCEDGCDPEQECRRARECVRVGGTAPEEVPEQTPPGNKPEATDPPSGLPPGTGVAPDDSLLGCDGCAVGTGGAPSLPALGLLALMAGGLFVWLRSGRR